MIFSIFSFSFYSTMRVIGPGTVHAFFKYTDIFWQLWEFVISIYREFVISISTSTKRSSCDHIMLWAEKLHYDAQEVYLNQIERYVQRRNDKNNPPRYICFLMTVGKDRKKGITYLGSGMKQGCHWSVVIYSAESK